MDYSRFQKVYANLPSKVREEVAVVVDGEPYSWNAAYLEISENTSLGQKMYDKLVKTEVI